MKDFEDFQDFQRARQFMASKIEPLLKCGSLTLYLHGSVSDEKCHVKICVRGGGAAIKAAPDDDVLLAMTNATMIGDLLKRELPPHWHVSY